MPGTLVLYTDGAARGNPGPAAIGAALYRLAGDQLIPLGEVSRTIGWQTNNVAEYQAVIDGLELAAVHRPDRLVLRADSELLIRQLRGSYRVKAPHLQPLFQDVQRLLSAIPQISFEHVRREHNTVADALANAALDS
jgi:ribonuclease HI